MPTTSTFLTRALMYSTCVATLAVTSAPAFAQGQEADSTFTLEEIVVTARKRAESLQETPIAISAFSAEALEDRGAGNINDVAGLVPNLQYSSSASGTVGASSFAIRGIGQSDFITTTEPGVGVYLDGVYLARVTGAALDLADVERVEVLRGPQGTLFGRNTIGGAVSVITAKPTGELGGKAEVTVGNHARFNGRFSADFPIVKDVLAGKVSFLAKNSDGYGYDNDPAGGGGNLGEERDVAGRVQLLYTPKDDMSFLLSADHTRRRGTVMPLGRVGYVQNAGNAAFDDGGTNSVIPYDDPNLVRYDTPADDELDVYGVSLTSDFGLGNMDLKLITAYREQSGVSGQDFDGGSSPILNQVIDSSQDQFSQEIQLTGTSFDDRLEWLVGAYYFRETGQFDQDVVLGGVPILIYTGSTTDSYALFAQGSYSLTEKLSVTAGLRWTSEKKSVDVDTFFGPFQLVDEVRDETFSAFSPKVSVEYQATDDVMVYASVGRGFRSGGFNGRPFSPNDLFPFDEETTTAYEVGLKSDLMDRKLRINVAGFYTDYKDIQLTATTQNDLGQFVVLTANAGKAEIYGIEAEVQAMPVEGLFVYGGLGYANNGNLDPQTGFTFDTSAGKNLPGASEWTLSLGGDYRFEVGDDWMAMIGADYSWRSRYDHQASNQTATVEEDGYGLLNARLTVGPEDESWKLTFYGKNLTDEVYRVYGQDSMSSQGVAVVWFGPTREYGVKLGFNF
ncbi:TonB-dependent receptor [Emcibacter sp.]|uniref:TonB-dependent receptor n=1 Tax=Emcibacter sp. TaxID=1979954 RepID=UPI002AA82943|nr:TonB-dependent receptor [Emcibacter sp.]